MLDRRSPRRIRAALASLVAALVVPAALSAAEPADTLLDRVPPDAALALVVEDLGEHARGLVGSPTGRALLETGPVRDWLGSDEGAKLRRARRDVEAALGVPLSRLADGLLGRAAVLSLHLPDGAPPGMARGLLQTMVTDRDLLDRFIEAANAAERGSGALVGVDGREHAGVSYSVRDFGDGRPDEAYVLLDDGTFVWTNAEALLLGVIDRLADPGGPALLDDPARDRVRRTLPDRAVARLFVDPRFVARLASAGPKAPDQDDLPPPVAAYLGAIDSLGAALEWREGPVLHVVEALDPARLPGPVRSWAAREGEAGPLLGLIPPSALLAAAGHVDAASLYDLALAAVPEGERGRVEALSAAIRGVMLGLDPRGEVLPAIDPGMVGWVDPPPPGRPLRVAPALLVASIADPRAAEAVDNALRTLLALVALDEGRRPRLRLAVRDGGDESRVTALALADDPAMTRFAYAVARGLVVVGTDAGAVAAVLADRSAAEGAGRRPAALVARDRLFPDASTFVHVDLDAFRLLAGDRVEDLADALGGRSAVDDLGRLMELLTPFRAAYATSTMAPDATTAHRRVGLVVAE